MAPKVLPTAISLQECQIPFRVFAAPKTRHVPHASKQLHQSTVSEGNTDNQVGRAQASSAHVDQAQHESGESESGKAQRCRIGEPTFLDALVETGLELSSESWETLSSAASVGVGERAVTEVGGGFGRLVLFVGHLTVHAGAVRLFVVVSRRIASVVGVGVGRHCGGSQYLL